MRSRFLLFFAILSHVNAVRNLQIASPLQSLTIWDPEVKAQQQSGEQPADGEAPSTTFRSRFLPRFKAGLQAEMQARKTIASQRKQRLQVDAAAGSGSKREWADRAAMADARVRNKDAKTIENAYDAAISKFDHDAQQQQQLLSKQKGRSNNQYQFVGVVNPVSAKNKPTITWYARKKPINSKWSVRVVHVNRAAIIKDLFGQGKVDIFAKYDNTGKKDVEKGNQPIVHSKYIVRERSWKNLWNFSPKHFITDSSGMYWRERRLRPGLYTDGNTVYQASYRYRDGRNGMRRMSTLQQYLGSKAIDPSQKSKVLRRLREDTPDVVLED